MKIEYWKMQNIDSNILAKRITNSQQRECNITVNDKVKHEISASFVEHINPSDAELKS